MIDYKYLSLTMEFLDISDKHVAGNQLITIYEEFPDLCIVSVMLHAAARDLNKEEHLPKYDKEKESAVCLVDAMANICEQIWDHEKKTNGGIK